MNKSTVIFAAILIAFIGYWITIYNNIVGLQQQVQGSWAQVQNMYQRRADLIPNLVNTVKGYAQHEKSTLEEVVKARQAAIQVPQVALPTSPEQLQQLEQAQQTLSGALSRLMIVLERYPDLKASQNFLSLQVELAGTENRIAVERRRYTMAAQSYNAYILKFPNNLIAEKFGYKTIPYFQAEANAATPPEVNFAQ
jgi:LemA protein